MTHLASSTPHTARHADARAAAVLAAALAALAALAIGTASSSTGASAQAERRVALVVDAGARPDAALARARAAATRAERSGAATVTVRLPRTAAEAVTDVRYFTAQGFDAVVAVGPLARRAAGAPGPTASATRVVTPVAVPRAVR